MFSVHVSVHAVALINCSVNNSTDIWWKFGGKWWPLVARRSFCISNPKTSKVFWWTFDENVRCEFKCETSEQKLLNLIRAHLLHRTFYNPPVVALDLLQLVELGGDVVDGELQQVPESSQVLRGGPRHGTWVLQQSQAFKHLLFIPSVDVMDMLRLNSV